jgi:S1-C subfamily serine protease
VSAQIVRSAQKGFRQRLVTSSVSSAVITNRLIFDARVTQSGDTILSFKITFLFAPAVVPFDVIFLAFTMARLPRKQAPLVEHYRRYRNAMVKFVVENREGDQSVGAGCHIGDGWVATAKHNLKDTKLLEARSQLNDLALTFDRRLTHPDPNIDLLILKCEQNLPTSSAPAVPIGTHLDAWIQDEFLLSKVLIMGFPKIPLTTRTFLVCAEAEVNAVVKLLMPPALHFVLSSTARGGFSGGPAITDTGELLGVITSSLISSHEPETSGFCVALSVEPLLQILRQLPQRPSFVPKDIWDTLD